MHQEGLYDDVRAAIEANGKEFAHELRNLYVSPVLAQALIDAGASFGENPATVSAALQNQFPLVEDVSNDETLDTFEEVLRLQSDTDGKLPLTLVVLDEMQQYIEDDNAKALQVQDLVEGCSSRFNSQVLVVATGQAALTANPTLQKLIDRFPVQLPSRTPTSRPLSARSFFARNPTGWPISRRHSTRSREKSTGNSAARASKLSGCARKFVGGQVQAVGSPR